MNNNSEINSRKISTIHSLGKTSVFNKPGILKILDKIITDGGAENFSYGEESHSPPRGVCYQKWCRLSVQVKGHTNINLVKNGDSAFVKANPGDGFFYPPYAWNSNVPPFDTGFFGIIFRESFVRYIYRERDISRKSPETHNYHYHTSGPLATPGQQILDALKYVSENKGDLKTGLLLFNALLRTCREELANDHPKRSEKSFQTFQHICEYIRDNFHLAINREETAQALKLHPNYISRLFKKQSGKSFSEYLKKIRMDHAAKLLTMGELQIDQIAAHSGFGDLAHFFKTFKSVYGMSPGTYRHRSSKSHSPSAQRDNKKIAAP